MDSKTKIYFEVSWIFKDGRSSTDGRPPRQFSMDIFQDTFDYLKQMDEDDKIDFYSTFFNAFEKECPEFNEEEYRLIYKSRTDNFLLEKRKDRHYGSQLNLEFIIITLHKETARNINKPIPLRIEQRLRKPKCISIVKSLRADVKHLGLCRECRGAIKDVLFQCSQCEEDCNLCGPCVISGKHPQHNVIIRSTDSKMADSNKIIKKIILESEKKDKETASETPNIDDYKKYEKKEEKVGTGCEGLSPASTITTSLMVSGNNTEDDAINSNVKSDVSSVCSGEWIMGEDIASLESQEATIPNKENSKNLAGSSSDDELIE